MKKLIQYFAANKMVVNIFVLVVFLGGLFIASQLKRESFPNVDIKKMMITTAYPGAAPLDVELNVTKKIEEELGEVSGLESYKSVSSENVSIIEVEINIDEKNADEIKDEVRNAVDRAEPEFPQEVEKPQIVELKVENMPVLNYLITSDRLPEEEMRKIADNLENEIEDTDGVSSVTKEAYRDAQIKIMADMIQLKANNVSLKDMENAVRNYNIRSGGGAIQSLTNRRNIVTMSQFRNLGEVRNVIIRSNFAGQKIRIQDVAEVKDGFEEREIYTRGNQQNGIMLSVVKKEDADIIRTANAVKQRVKNFAQKIKIKYGSSHPPLEIKAKALEVVRNFKNKVTSLEQSETLVSILNTLEKLYEQNFTEDKFPDMEKRELILRNGMKFQQVLRDSGGSEKIKKEILATIEDLQDRFMDQVNIIKVMDATKEVDTLLSITINNAFIGFVLVLLVLMIALNFKVAFWTAFGIPTALMMGFMGMAMFDFSINMISLFGIITVLGIIVDDGIVVSENIHSKQEKGITGVRAAVEGAHEMLVPIMGAVLTTILAFIPLTMMGGILGEFLFQLPMVVIIALIAATIEVFVALPCHLTHKKPGKKVKKTEEGKISLKLKSGYRSFLKYVLKARYLVVIFFIGLLIFSFGLASKMDFILFSNEETDLIYVEMEAPEGVGLEEMLRRTKKVEQIVAQEIPYQKEMEAMITTVGNGSADQRLGTSNEENAANIQIRLVPFDKRKRIAAEMVKGLQEQIRIRPHIQSLFKKEGIVIKEQKPGPPVGAPVDVKLISNNEQLRAEYAAKLTEFLKKQPGIFSIQNDNENTKEEVQLDFNYDQMYRLGVNPAVVASTVRMGFNGKAVTSVAKIKEDVDVVIQLQEKYRFDLNLLKQLLIPTSYQGRQIRLGQIADFKIVKTQSLIRHYNGKRTTSVTAQLDTDKNTATKVMQQVKSYMEPLIQQYPELRMKISGEGEKSQESVRDAGIAFIFALFAIFLVLLLIFRSVSQSLIVLSAIPFGLIGIIIAFKVHGEPLGFFAMVGIVGLAGVIVNNSIVMIDLINKLRGQGKLLFPDLLEKVKTGAADRIRPIILTTVTTVAALIPTVYGIGGSSPMIKPLAMSLSYGLIFGTAITLLLLPSLYVIDQDIRRVYGKSKAKMKNTALKLLKREKSV